jgi:hypothetical protein
VGYSVEVDLQRQILDAVNMIVAKAAVREVFEAAGEEG